MTTPVPHSQELLASRLPQAGDLLDPRYRVERLLGVGGMGAVFEVSHLELGQRMAVKIMLPGLAADAKNAARFLREGKAAAALRSEHVARIVDLGKCPDGSPFLVMELLQGEDLERHVRSRGPLALEDAVGYTLQACDAIAEAHALGIVHRDLKPSNIFLCRSEGGGPSKIKVLDFGISKATKLNSTEVDQQGLTATDATLGSPRFMSPEQLRDARRVDARSDIWSIGLILHWLLTGHYAFEAETLGEHLMMIVAEPPTPLRKRLPDAPVELEMIVLRCLERSLERRYQDIGELVLSLEPFAPSCSRHLVPRIIELLDQAMQPGTPRPVRSSSSVRSASDRVLPSPDATHSSWAHRGAGAKPRGRNQGLLLGIGVGLSAALLAITAGQRWPDASHGSATSPEVLLPAPPREEAPAVTPAVVAAPAAPAREPAEVQIQLRISPSDVPATVELNDTPIEGNVLHLPKSGAVHKLVVSAPGYKPESRSVRATASSELVVSLSKLPSAAPAQPARRVVVAPAQAGRPASGPQPSAPEPSDKPSRGTVKGPLENQL